MLTRVEGVSRNGRPAAKRSNLALYMRILRESKHFWPHIFALAAISLLDTPLTLLNPLPLKIVVDSVLGTHPLPSWLTWLFPEGTKRTDVLVILVVSGLLVIIELIKQCV